MIFILTLLISVNIVMYAGFIPNRNKKEEEEFSSSYRVFII